jgi:hypothetical protein
MKKRKKEKKESVQRVCGSTKGEGREGARETKPMQNVNAKKKKKKKARTLRGRREPALDLGLRLAPALDPARGDARKVRVEGLHKARAGGDARGGRGRNGEVAALRSKK